MNILVTGCNGQLGNEIQLLQSENTQYRWFNTDVKELDITDQDAVNNYVKTNSIYGIINCAAFTAVDKAETNVPLCTKLNAEAPAILATAIEKQNGWLIQISTDYVFNGTNFKPYTEEDKPAPDSVYGITKLKGEQAITKICKKALIIRTAWLYSIFGNNFVKTMVRLGKERDELNVVFDQIGSPTYAHDLAQAIMTIINHGVTAGLYNFSNEGIISWYDFTKAIHRIAGITSCKVNPVHTEEYPTPAHRPHYSVLDKTKIKKTYNIEIPYWETSLEKCIKQLSANERN
jgi:dTDP-4-dehydrorhamnose reductase